jgi:hypothetical protein
LWDASAQRAIAGSARSAPVVSPSLGAASRAKGRPDPNGASPVRHDASAYVLGVAKSLYPELAEPQPAVRHNRVDDLERTTS